jgi:hypothetical protein
MFNQKKITVAQFIEQLKDCSPDKFVTIHDPISGDYDKNVNIQDLDEDNYIVLYTI